MQLSPLVAELERLYVLAAGHWFKDRQLAALMDDRPAIAIASRGRKATVNGWYTPAVWSDAVDDVLDFLAGDDTPQVNRVKAAEIVIAAEVLDNPTQALAELVRQMYCHAVPGARPAGFYYRATWADHAAQFGCTVEVHPDQPSKGLSCLVPGPAFKRWAAEVLNPSVWSVSREGLTAVKVGSRMKKWECQCTIVRCATYLDATCKRCGAPFTYTDSSATMPSRAGKRVVK